VTDKMIHHESVLPEGGTDGDEFDVIENDDGFNVVQTGNAVATFDTLDEARADAYERAERWEESFENARKLEEDAKEEPERMKREAMYIADVACFMINRRKLEFPATKYAAQALLEHVVEILNERI
jgi:hypothetical protein